MSMQQEQQGIAPNAKGESGDTSCDGNEDEETSLCYLSSRLVLSHQFVLPPTFYIRLQVFYWPPLRPSASFLFPISSAE